MKAEFEAMSAEQVVAHVRAILDPGPWQVGDERLWSMPGMPLEAQPCGKTDDFRPR
jgi:hypothetical protein